MPMLTYDLPLQEPLAAEATAALIDIVELAQRVGSVPFEGLGTLASEMLKRLLALFSAQRGAVLLEVEDQASREQRSLSFPAKAFRPLALPNIRAEDVYALLAAFPSTGVQSHTSSDLSCWVTYRLTLDGTTEESGHAPGPPSQVSESLATLRSTAFSQPRQDMQAVLVLGWTGEHEGAYRAAVEKCHTLLPVVAKAAGAFIASLVLAERVHELEAAAVREALQGMELLKAELLGTVSHELRGPLASIKGYAATLLRQERRLSREERHQFLLAINEASARLDLIIARLLEASQLETGQVTIELAPVDVARLASEAITTIEERVAHQLPGRFIFHLHLQDADGGASRAVPLILADQRRLREVFDNLLENAVKFSPEGGLVRIIIRPTITSGPHRAGFPLKEAASLEEEKAGGQLTAAAGVPQHLLEICVCDNGLGIPDEHLERIFERFHRADTRLTREANGLGLGLTICKRIVELHGGVIWAENRPGGQGSAFYVHLPMSPAPLT